MDWRSIIIRPAPRRLSRRLSGSFAIAAAATGLLLSGGASAQAALLSNPGCNSTPESQPFAPWGDTNEYELVTGGDFQNGAPGWTLSGGAQIVAGGDSYVASGTPESLELPAGASATSPATCVDLSDPTLRFFMRAADSTGGKIQVTLLYNNLVLGLLPPSDGAVTPTSDWQPSPQLTTDSTLGTLLSLGNARVSLRFTAVGGPVQIDDVYIDPRCV